MFRAYRLLFVLSALMGIEAVALPGHDGPTLHPQGPTACERYAARDFFAQPATPFGIPQVEPSPHANEPALDDSPRLPADLTRLKRVGSVDFPSTCRKQAKPFLNQGVALLHDYFWPEAERSFRTARTLDPHCFIASWGMAMAANGDIFGNAYSARAAQFLEDARAEMKNASPADPASQSTREKESRYVEAFAELYQGLSPGAVVPLARRQRYMDAMRKLVADYPDDLEAKAFLIYGYLKNSDTEGVSWHTQDPSLYDKVLRKAVPLVDAIYKANPDHPVVHDAIHLLNYRHDDRGVYYALQSGPNASDVPHMWHMGSHPYFNLAARFDMKKVASYFDKTGHFPSDYDPDTYRKAAYYQLSALRRYNRLLAQSDLNQSDISDYHHNAGWLLETLNRTGQSGLAISIAKDLIDEPGDPEAALSFDDLRTTAKHRLMDALNESQRWDEVIQLSSTHYLDRGENLLQEIKRLRLLGVAFYHRSDLNGLDDVLSKLDCLEAKPEVELLRQSKLELEAYRDLLSGRKNRARTRLEQVAKSLGRKPFYYEMKYGPTPGQVAQALQRAGNESLAMSLVDRWLAESPNEVEPLAQWIAIAENDPGESGKLDAYRMLLRRIAVDSDLSLSSPSAQPEDLWAREQTLMAAIEAKRKAVREGGGSEAGAVGGPRSPLDYHPLLSGAGPLKYRRPAAPSGAIAYTRAGNPVFLEEKTGHPLLLVFLRGAHLEDRIRELRQPAKELGSHIVIVTDQAPEKIDPTDDAGEVEVVSSRDLSAFRSFNALDLLSDPPIPYNGAVLIKTGEILFRKISADWLGLAPLAPEIKRMKDWNSP